MRVSAEKSNRNSAFTKVEVVIVAAILGMLSMTAVRVVTAVPRSAGKLKLESDVRALNSALQIYLASGGRIEESSDVDDVLRRLVTVTNSEYADLVPGLGGSFIDPRIKPVYQTESESETNRPRAVWSNALARFEVLEGGPRGIAKFILDDAMEYVSEEEEREFAFLYKEGDGWLWDYTDAMPRTYDGPTVIETVSVVSDSILPEIVTEEEPTDPGEALLPPEFSVPGGVYPCSRYDILLDLTNPNEGLNTDIFYRTNYGSWVEYSGTIVVSPDTVVEAQVISDHEGYSNSPMRTENYLMIPEPLPAPTLDLDLDVDLVNGIVLHVDVGTSLALAGIRIEASVDGGAWTEVDGTFDIRPASLLAMLDIRVRLVSDHECYEDSEILGITADIAALVDLEELPVLPLLPLGG